jgi:tRNA A37 threonylcarbamoyladenosine modification protein TsaB
MDAARHEVFTALYEASSGTALEILEPAAVDAPAAAFARWVARLGERPLLAVGEGAVRYADVLRAAIPRARLVEPGEPLAAVAGRLAQVAHREGRSGPPHAIRPLYVRRPDAELARERRIATAAPLPRSS